MAKTQNKTTKAVVLKGDEKQNEISQFIQQAITSKLPVETMERLFNLRKEVKAEIAKEEFVKAMAQFQRDCPIIEKKRKVKNRDGSLRYQYASMDDVIEQIKKPLSENGLSYSWDSVLEQSNGGQGHIKITCKLTHEFGYTETSTFAIPIEKSEYMTSPQSYATAQTYAKRYTLLNVLGIGTADEDTDAIDTGRAKEVQSTKSRIAFALKALGYDIDKWTQEQWQAKVKELIKLSLTSGNLAEIANRLDVLVKEKQENEGNKI